MARSHPGSGTYRLTPNEQGDQGPYDVVVEDDECERYPISPYPWNSAWQDFRVTRASGWTYGYVCFDNGTYIHFAIDPNAEPPGLIIIDQGSCVKLA